MTRLALLLVLAGVDSAVQDETERARRERDHDAAQRSRAIGIVSLQLKDSTFEAACDALGKQTEFRRYYPAQERFAEQLKLSIDVRDVPLRQCLDQIEAQIKVAIEADSKGWYAIRPASGSRKPRTHIPGLTFEFNLARFNKDPKAGWSLAMNRLGPLKSFVDRLEVFDLQKNPVKFDWCGRCSPDFVRLRAEGSGPFEVKVKGRLVWESPYELSVSDPGKTQEFKVGPFDITYEFPGVAWRSAEPVMEHLIGQATLVGRLQKRFKNPGVYDYLPPEEKVRKGRAENGWCRCEGEPAPAELKASRKRTSGRYRSPAYEDRTPDQFESMKVRFYKAIEERFETEAQVTVE